MVAFNFMSFDWHIWAAARVLRRGGVLVHPTDTVLGLAASVLRPDAIDQVSLIKSRPPGQTFIVIAAAIDMLWALTAERSRGLLARAGRWRHRATGGVLLAAAAGLALVRK